MTSQYPVATHEHTAAPTPPTLETRPKPPLWLGIIFTVCGLWGLVPSARVLLDQIEGLKDPNFVAVCDYNAVFSCTDVMRSDAATTFGISNSFYGLAGFGAVAALGVAMLAGARFAGWLWFLIGVGMTVVVGFCMYLAAHAIFTLGALCTNCIQIWAAAIILFCATVGFTFPAYGGDNAMTRAAGKWWWALAVVWMVVIGVTMLVVFRDFFFN